MAFKIKTKYNGPGVYAIIDIYNYLSDKYKGYRDIKTSHNRTNKPG